MNKKFGVILFLGILILSMSFSSAGWFSDVWGKITGNIITGDIIYKNGFNTYDKYCPDVEKNRCEYTSSTGRTTYKTTQRCNTYYDIINDVFRKRAERDDIYEVKVLQIGCRNYESSFKRAYTIECPVEGYDLCIRKDNDGHGNSVVLGVKLFSKNKSTCSSFTYSGWSTCVNGKQTRTILTSSPSGCVGGNPILNQSCGISERKTGVTSLYFGKIDSSKRSKLANSFSDENTLGFYEPRDALDISSQIKNSGFSTSSGSISLWINSNKSTREKTIQASLFSMRNKNLTNFFELFLWNSTDKDWNYSNKITFRYGSGVRNHLISAPLDWSAGKWHHVVVTWDSSGKSKQSIYIDGRLSASVSDEWSPKELKEFDDFYLGIIHTLNPSVSNPANGAFSGIISDFRVYREILSSVDVQNMYESMRTRGQDIDSAKSVYGETYYVDNILGNDLNSGLSPESPWKTIKKVSGFNFKPGDYVLFRRGRIFYNETLTVKASGINGKQIVYGAYGSGEKPIIDPSTSVTGFKKHSGNIYVANIGKGLKFENLFVGEDKLDIAHEPDGDYFYPTKWPQGKDHLFDEGKFTSSQLQNASIHLRYAPWVMGVANVTSYDRVNKKLYFNLTDPQWWRLTEYKMQPAFGYYLSNKLWMLDSPGEWFYDSVSGNLFVWSRNGANPDAQNIRIALATNAIQMNGKKNVVVTDLAVRNTVREGIYVVFSSGIVLNNLNVLNGGSRGIIFTYSNNSILINSLVKNSDGMGIYAWEFSNISIKNNIVINTGVDVPHNAKQGGAISVSGGGSNNALVENNDILNSAYSGVGYNGINVVIKNNYINNSCMVLDDCGAMYTNGNATKGTIIYGNIIENTRVNFVGLKGGSTSADIYLDDNSNYNNVSNNILINFNNSKVSDFRGVYLHNSRNNTVFNNTVVNKDPMFYGEGGSAVQNYYPGFLHGNSVSKNVFISIAPNSPAVKQRSYWKIQKFGTQDYNSYFSYLNNAFLTFAENITTKKNEKNYSLKDWQNSKKQDVNSVDINSFYKVKYNANRDFKKDFLILLNIDRNSEKRFTLSQKYCDLDNKDVSGSVVVAPWSVKILLSCYCNNDGACNNKETRQTCPNDCK